jgi:hypothetical protein
MHCGAEVTESSTNKQHHLSRALIFGATNARQTHIRQQIIWTIRVDHVLLSARLLQKARLQAANALKVIRDQTVGRAQHV